MWLLEDSKIYGYVNKCMVCGFMTLNYNKWHCDNDGTKLQEVLLTRETTE